MKMSSMLKKNLVAFRSSIQLKIFPLMHNHQIMNKILAECEALICMIFVLWNSVFNYLTNCFCAKLAYMDTFIFAQIAICLLQYGSRCPSWGDNREWALDISSVLSFISWEVLMMTGKNNKFIVNQDALKWIKLNMIETKWKWLVILTKTTLCQYLMV